MNPRRPQRLPGTGVWESREVWVEPHNLRQRRDVGEGLWPPRDHLLWAWDHHMRQGFMLHLTEKEAEARGAQMRMLGGQCLTTSYCLELGHPQTRTPWVITQETGFCPSALSTPSSDLLVLASILRS
jgi:hypothetical protein